MHYVRAVKPTLFALLLAACSGSLHHRINNAALAVAEGTLACDWKQTHILAEGHWANQTYEKNMLLGESPSADTINWYFAGVMTATAVVSNAMPEWARSLVLVGMIAVEARTIHDNLPTTGTCL